MADKPLDPEAHARWRRVAATVRPLKGRRLSSRSTPAKQASVRPEAVEACPERLQASRRGRVSSAPPAASPSTGLRTNGSGVAGGLQRLNGPPAAKAGPPTNTLDASWDRKLARGIVAPDFTIDLHGHTLAGAHTALEAGLAHAVAREARLVLLVTGKPPPPGRSRLDNPLRGVIRASIGDWLAHSRSSTRIAAVRNAHPKHGGAGALYVVMRRARDQRF
jgi:DNA-nicking Smr family endonuclease